MLRPLAHLRAHAVAYLALVVACSGTSYAAVALPRNSVGAAQIKVGAVRGPEVEDRSLRAVDFARGQLPAGPRGPAGPTFVALQGGFLDPAAAPDATADTFDFSLPRAGTVVVEMFAQPFGSCTSGSARVGLYVDGEPLAGTAYDVASTAPSAQPVFPRGSAALAAGAHTATLRLDCPFGNWVALSPGVTTWEVSLVGTVQRAER
jgi:hypothetical protein